jgi:hypothetical protein
MADLDFDIPQRSAEQHTFSLPSRDRTEKERYTFLAPKSAVLTMPVLAVDVTNDRQSGQASTKALFDWLGAGLTAYDRTQVPDEQRAALPEDWEGPQSLHLQERLRDPHDDLDVDTLGRIGRGLLEAVSTRPTTSPSASLSR